jgi:hypothetical protein
MTILGGRRRSGGRPRRESGYSFVQLELVAGVKRQGQMQAAKQVEAVEVEGQQRARP